MPKILTIDIETRPAMSYHWRMFKENIGIEQVVEPGGILCFAAKWLGSPEVVFYSEWEHGQDFMIAAAHDLLSEADAVVGFNHKKFDIPHLMTEFALLGLNAPPPLTLIDVLSTVKYKFRLLSNKLAFVGPFFQIGKKMEHEGFPLWRKVMDGDEKAQKRMQRYCIQDVRLTERVYRFILPFIHNHPHLSPTKVECGACGSKKTQKRGFRYTRSFKIQRIQCTSCGSWQDGAREKIK